MLKTIVWCVFVFGLIGTTVVAQSPATSFTARYYNVGAPAPVQTEIFPASAVACNQTLPSSPDPTNPTKIYFSDVAGSTPTNIRYCVYTTPTTGSQLRSLPLGNFEGTLAASNAAGASAESTRVPFSRPAPIVVPAVPTGVSFLKD